MLVIIFRVELHHGLKGGYELPLALATMAFVLIFFGAGPISLDATRRREARNKKQRKVSCLGSAAAHGDSLAQGAH